MPGEGTGGAVVLPINLIALALAAAQPLSHPSPRKKRDKLK